MKSGTISFSGPFIDLGQWLESQRRRERRAARLEDALLGGRYATYFAFRLRFFCIRTVFAAILHAIKILLVAKAFSQSDLLIILAVGAGTAIASDFWWGALEPMRQAVRVLRRDGAMHQAFREIGRWVWLGVALSSAGVAVALAAVAVPAFLQQGLHPVGAFAGVMLAGAALRITVRAYHSGAYAVRRVYRSIGSLVVADSIAVAALLALQPLLGLWAFVVAEAAGALCGLALAIHYTGRTYDVLGLPRLWVLLRAPWSLPSVARLRSGLSPGLAYALIGAESVMVLAVLMVPGGTAKPALVVLLAALGPLVRGGFEWAQLLYFDLVRLGLPLLRELRRRFDASVLVLAVVAGMVTSGVAVALGAAVLGVRDPVLLLLLLPLCSSRSLLASAQVRTFTDGAYVRLASVGGLVGLGAMAALSLANNEAGRLAVLSFVLAVASIVLLVYPRAKTDADSPVLALPDWLAQLRRVRDDVAVTRVNFDTSSAARGVTAEDRQTAEWRRRQIAAQVAVRVNRSGGAVAWLDAYHLVWFGPAIDLGRIVRLGGGMIENCPTSQRFASGAVAAETICGVLGVQVAVPKSGTDVLLAEFSRMFPAGIVYRAGRAVPHELAAISSRTRADLLGAALSYARDLNAVRRARWEVTSLVADGALEMIFLVDQRSARSARHRWAKLIRTQNLLGAALGTPRGRPKLQDRDPVLRLPPSGAALF